MFNFNMTDDEFLRCGIKLIDGMAGSRKSSGTHDRFVSLNKDYERHASTNRGKEDSILRYNMPVTTVAAGLFVNHGTHFYAEEKDPQCENVVIDEILQTHPKVIDWCIHHADNCNIIVTTDSRQLLSPENEIQMLNKFEELKNHPSTIYRRLTDTYRPRNAKTKKLYEQFYELADKPMLINADWMKNTFPNVIYYEDMIYSPNDAYITHDNLTEDYLYKDQGFTSNPDLVLIPKGCLASKPPKNIRSYPILSQLQADKTHARSYTQVMNVGSAVRFQGSEVMSDQKLYFLIQPTSMISTRELYTVITRMWDIDSFVIVLVNTPKPYVISSFNDLPVKTFKKLTVNETGNTVGLKPSEMEALVSKYDTDTIYYDRTEVKGSDGSYKYVNTGVKREQTNKHKSTVASLAKRDSSLNYSYMDKVYSIFEEHDIPYAKIIQHLGSRKHGEDDYEIDMRSAHPTMLKFEKMPIDGIIKWDKPHEDMLNFYVYKGNIFSNNALVTDDLKSYIDEKGYGECEYLFSTPYTIGTFPGDWLYDKATDTKESKASIKHMHYGYWMRHYLQKSPDETCYVRYESYVYELLICAIYSQILYYMRKIYDAFDDSTVLVIDGVYIKEYNDSKLEVIKSILPEHIGFRVRSAKRDKVYYQSYPELPTKEEKHAKQTKASHEKNKEARNAQKREKYNNMTEEERKAFNQAKYLRRKQLKAEKGAKNHEQEQ